MQTHPAQFAMHSTSIHPARRPERPTFEALWNAYELPVYRYVTRMVGNSEDARDLTQDTFIKILSALPRLSPHRTHAWVFRIATNVCLDTLRRRTVRSQSLDELLEGSPMAEAELWDAARRSTLAGPCLPANALPEDTTLQREQRDYVQVVLDRLFPKHRTVLILREYHAFTHAEIGEALGITCLAARMLLYRARKEFRVVWRQAWGSPLAPSTGPALVPPASTLGVRKRRRPEGTPAISPGAAATRCA